MFNVMRSVPLVPLLLRASPRKRLWLAGAGLALFMLTFVVGNGFIRRDRAVTRADLGHDFLAFYTAATFVRDGHARNLYDLEAVRQAEQATARAAGIDLGSAFGPWWNPPFYALALEPLARLPYARALDLWRWINVASLVAAAGGLGRMTVSKKAPDVQPITSTQVRMPRPRPQERRPRSHESAKTDAKGKGSECRDAHPEPRRRRVPFWIARATWHSSATPTSRLSSRLRGFAVACFFPPSRAISRVVSMYLDVHPGLRSAALVLLLLVTSMPFIQAIGHAQNTCTSLLLLTVTVALWRAERAVWAGVVGGLLFYKPQLAAVVAGVMAIDLGWAAVGGLAITGVALLVVTTIALPGSLGDWLHKLPANVRFMQVEHPYLWDRHVTIKAFWRLLLQGTAAGEATMLTSTLTAASWIAIAGPLAWAAICTRRRGGEFEPRRREGAKDHAKEAMPVTLAEPIRDGVGSRWRAGNLFAFAFGPSRLRGSILPQQKGQSRDRLIVATVCAMPLLMPFYFDYDLLLLAVPITLYAADGARDRSLTAGWALVYAWMFINAPVASQFRFGGAAVLLAGVTALAIRRVNRVEADTSPLVLPRAKPFAAAA